MVLYLFIFRVLSLYFLYMSVCFLDAIFIPIRDIIRAQTGEEEVGQLTDLWLAAIVAGVLLVYLVYALMKPEEF